MQSKIFKVQIFNRDEKNGEITANNNYHFIK